MLCLKEANLEDMEKEYQFITNTPEEENGFTNPDAGCTRDDFRDHILPGYLRAAKGEGLPEGWVPETRLFLWDGDDIAGLFRIRHYLNEALANGAAAIAPGAMDWAGLILISFVLPAVICPLVNQLCRKAGWVKDGDLTLAG